MLALLQLQAMFGFGLIKLIFLAAIGAFLWYGAKALRRLDGRPRGGKPAQPSPEPPARHAADPGGMLAVDLVECRVCGAYVAAPDSGNCGRAECPYRK